MNTKAYVILLATVVVAGFVFIGVVLFHDPVLVRQRPEVVYLDMDSLNEASNSIIDSLKGPAVDKIFPADHQNTKNDSIPWADVYVCRSFEKADSLSGDTVIMVLDTKTDDKLDKVKYPEDYWTGLKKAAKFTRCRIVVPTDEFAWLKKAHYKFASVQLITEDEDGLK